MAEPDYKCQSVRVCVGGAGTPGSLGGRGCPFSDQTSGLGGSVCVQQPLETKAL